MLHRRAGFGANWQQLQRDLEDGPQPSIERMLAGQSRAVDAEAFEATSEVLLRSAVRSGQISRLSAWWIYRMYLGSNPLAERRTLMWHNHFATSQRTIQNVFRMYRQNHLFRTLGQGKFRELLITVIKDPAMLLWLNANDNRPAHPNENLARELMELFSLGIGNYSEDDVKEAARALAGWTTTTMPSNDDPFSETYSDTLVVRQYWKDRFSKTILGQTGEWDGDDLLDMVLKHPATPRRLAWRICDELFGEQVVSDEALEELATGLVDHELDIEWAFATVLKSELFFSKENLKTRIAAPETFVLGNLIALDTTDTPASTMALDNVLTILGRSLFRPPNVGGWDGGRLWLNGRTLVARANFVHELVANGLNRNSKRPEYNRIINAFENPEDIESTVTQLSELLLGVDRDNVDDQGLIKNATRQAKQQSSETRWPFTVQLLLSTPSSQLC